MLKVYGTEMCPDCVDCTYNLDANKIEYEFIDITKRINALKEFIRLRDRSEAFDFVKDNGGIGIPALVTDEGAVTVDWERYLADRGITAVHLGETSAICSIESKAC